MNKITPNNISDLQLFQLCQQYGAAALEARRKFLGLLPEVNRRRLWQTKGFSSIFEFAAKLAGVSEELVRRTLNLEKRLQDKPLLHSALIDGKISVHKLVQIARIATDQNQGFWAAQAEVLSKSALETLVKDEKLLQTSVPGNTQIQLIKESVKLADDVQNQLLDLQKKGIDINELIRKMLAQRNEQIAAQKVTLGKIEEEKITNSRYIPIQIRRVIKQEHGNKCSIASCPRPSSTLHHTRRFAITASHDPNYLAPLCREHHEIAHSIDQKYQIARTAQTTSPSG